MRTEPPIIAYDFVPIDIIAERLSEGFEPHGSPIAWNDDKNSTEKIIYQAMVKQNPAIVQTKQVKQTVNVIPLTEIEHACIQGLMNDLTNREIA